MRFTEAEVERIAHDSAEYTVQHIELILARRGAEYARSTYRLRGSDAAALEDQLRLMFSTILRRMEFPVVT